jgi:hypothetical protein
VSIDKLSRRLLRGVNHHIHRKVQDKSTGWLAQNLPLILSQTRETK